MTPPPRYANLSGMALSSLQYDAYRVLAPIFAAALLVILALSRNRSLRANPASKVFTVFICATVGFLVANTLEISTATPAGNLFWSRAIYLFIPFIPLLWLSFTFHLAYDKPMKAIHIALLLVIPILTLGMVFSDDWMALVWSSIEYVKLGDFFVSVRRHGPWFLVQSLYSYAVSLVGLLIAVRTLTLKRLYFRKRSALLLAGVSVPIVVNVIFVLRPFPWLVKDFTPIAYAISGFFFFFALHRMDAFSIVPVAREQLVERMSDGIIVFDAEHRIADANKAALDILDAGESLIGRCLDSDDSEAAKLPGELTEAALKGSRSVYRKKRSDGSIAHYSIESIDLPGRPYSRGRLLVIRDETELRVALARLEELARTDSLTGIANRRGFMENAESLVSAAERYGEQLAVAMFDLDHFKNANDEWGHAVGDEVLRVFAGILQKDLRGADQAGRIGGEEFALILPKTGAPGAFSVCERIRKDFAEHVFRSENGNSFRVTVSVGISSPRDAPYSLAGLLAAADAALYRAKAAGKNRTVVGD